MTRIVRLIGDRVLLKRLPPDRMEGALHLSDDYLEKQRRCLVVQVGQGVRLKDGTYAPHPFKPGDIVRILRHGGHTIDVDGVEHHIAKCASVTAIID